MQVLSEAHCLFKNKTKNLTLDENLQQLSPN